MYPGKIPLSQAYELVASKIIDKKYADDAKRALIPLATENVLGQLIIDRSVVEGIIGNALGLMGAPDPFADTDSVLQKVLFASIGKSNGGNPSTSTTITMDFLDVALKQVVQDEASLTGPTGKQDIFTPVAPAIKLPPYLQLIVTQQKGYSCGFHAVFNALAIQMLFKKAEELTSRNIIDKAKLCHTQIVRTDVLLPYIAVDKLAQGNELRDFFVLSYDGTTQKMGFTDLKNQSPSDVETALIKLKTSISGLIHFICNTGEHWVSISVVKCIGQNPFLLYMDSLNKTVAERKVVAKFLNYLHARLQ